MSLLFHKVFGYREKVIRKNLEETFPSLNHKEINGLIKRSYRNLTDIIIEGIKGFVMTKSQVLKRHKILNPEISESLFNKGQSAILVTGHYNNWEWGGLSGPLFSKHKVIGFYKPLNNPYVDRFMKWSRSRTGTELASIYKTTRTFQENKTTPSLYLMAADQSPSKPRNVHWVNFLGRETAFLHGPAKHAIQNNIPIIFGEVQRIKRGYYEITLSLLIDDPSKYTPEDITQKFASKFGDVIEKKPENWLWSHRRWKLNKT